jgi:uncharacterized protein (TIGR01777 family)
MHLMLPLLAIQIALGAFDNLWHHEIAERLPARRSARAELAMHSLRELCYALLFTGLAWWDWRGAWTFALAAILVAEIVATLADFVIEDATRRLPRLERLLHTVLAINFGALLATFAPTLVEWSRLPTAIVAVERGPWSWFLTACGALVLAWSARNGLAAVRHFRRPAWERRGLAAAPRHGGKHVLVTGATGFIGRNLVYRLAERGDRVTVLARDRDKATDLFGPHATIVTSLDDVSGSTTIDAIVNLAGAPIATSRWTTRRKQELKTSRIAVTEALVGLVARLSRPPVTWINASAIGYYGVRADDVALHEKSDPQPVFQSELCRAWETCAARASAYGVKVALLRFGLVLGGDGGVLPALVRPVRLGVRTVFGTGTQWVSWIHLHDLLELILFVLDQATLAGPVNATAPIPVRQAELMDAIAAALPVRALRIAIPAHWLRALLGEVAELFVDGQRVAPERATALGFKFRYATAGAALESLLARRTENGAVVPHAS